MIDDDEPEKPKTARESSKFWQTQLGLAHDHHRDWWDRAREIVKRYRNERAKAKTKSKGRSFAILYANTETYKAVLYARQAKPDVRRRYADKNNRIGRVGGEILERVLSYQLDDDDSEDAFEAGVFDYALSGRGIIRVVYEPEIKPVDVTDPMTGQVTQQDMIVDQVVRDEHIAWDDFLHSPAKSWKDVWWCAFRHRMSRQDLRDNDFDNADDIALNWQPDADGRRDMPEDLKRAEVWEIWDKRTKKRRWVVKGHDTVLRTDDDPYQLKRFWPLAQPLNWGLTTDTLIPTPDFDQYESLADDLDQCIERISQLTKAMKRRGIYDISIPELKRLAKAGDNEFIPVKNYAAVVQAGGLVAAFQTEDISKMATQLTELYRQRDALVQGIYELTGISDIMRGATDASETATAQQLKAEYGSNRIKGKQRRVQKWIRNHLRIKAEIIAEHFEPNVLMQVSGMQLEPQEMMQVVQMFRDDRLRSYMIDIETDSTIFEDAEADKQARIEVMTALGEFAMKAMPVLQQAPPMAPLLFEVMTFTLAGFKQGRAIEDAVDEARNQLMQMMQQQMENPKPSPEEMKMQLAQAQGEKELALKDKDIQLKDMDIQMKQVEVGLKGEEVEAKRSDRRNERKHKKIMSRMEQDSAIHAEAVRRDAASHDMQVKKTGADIDLQGRAAKAGIKGAKNVKAGQPLPPDPTVVAISQMGQALGQMIQQSSAANMQVAERLEKAINAPKKVRAVKRNGVMEAEIVPEVNG